MSDKKSRKMRMGSSRRRPRNLNDNETENDGDGSELLSEESKGVKLLTDLVSMTPPMDPVSSDQLPSITTQFMDDNSNSSVNDFPDSQLFQTRNPNLLESPVTTGKRKKMGSTRRNRENQEDRDCGEKQDKESGDTEKSLELQASILTLGVSVSHSNMEQRLSPRESEEDTENRSQIGQGFTAESTTQPQQESEQTEAEYFFNNSRHSSDYLFESDASTITEDFETCNNTIVSQTEDDEEKLQPVINESEVHDDINSTEPDPPSVQRFVGPEETANVEPHPAERRRKMGSTRSRTPQGRQREERPEESQEVEHKENPEVIGQIGEVMRAELTEPVELKENVGKVTEYQVRDKTETLAVEDCNITAEEKCPNYTNVSESKAIGKRRKMGSTRQTRGFHTEEGKREVEKKVFHEEVKWENIRDPEVIVISDKIPKDYRAEAVSLEDQQKRPIAETQDVDTNIGSSGERAEHVTPALQPGQANKMSQEKDGHIYTSPVTKAMNQPRGTLGSSGSRSNPYHVVTVGNSNVGKTSFIKFFQSGEFSMDYAATIGIDTCIQSVKVDGSPVTLQIWDTAGQERYHSITRQVFHKAQGLLLIYDITSSQSFYDIRYWVNCIQEGAPSDAVILLLGNKTDCAEAERKVQTNEGKNLAKEHNMLFMECSAATGENVILSMEALARKIKQLGVETRQEEESLMLHKEPPRKKLSCC